MPGSLHRDTTGGSDLRAAHQLYYGAVRTLAQDGLGYIRKHELLKAGDRVGAAVSGGADSVAMLRLLVELRREIGIVLSVVHFNHRLRGAESDADEQFVAELARRNELELHCESGDVARHAAEKHLSLETAAREMRYAYFRRLLNKNCANRIATAHTLDDQAETVLMRLVRGAGTRGLAGIYPQFSVPSSQFSDGDPQGSIIRPLLGVRRKVLESYLKAIGQDWREDASNRDLRHARNRVRHEILPRLEENLNPAVREALAETAEIARAEEEYWKQEVDRLLPTVWHDPKKSLRLPVVINLPLALQRRVIRAAAESLELRLEFRQVEEIHEICSGSAKSAELPDGWRVSRNQQELWFERAESTLQARGLDYEYRLSVPGGALLSEAGTRLEAVLVPGNASGGLDREDLLDPAAVASELVARNWRPGDRFWPAHTKAPKKIKELLQEKRITGPGRQLWPVLVSGSEIVWVRGLPTPEHLRPRQGSDALMILALMIPEDVLSEEF
jgi:tRNA(Ile)-lysidine synthase